MKTVLFACVHNAGRSQMAAALFNVEADPAKARAISAGTEPGPRVHPEVVVAMQELGVDLTQGQPRKLTPELAREAELLITMGCGEACTAVPGLRRDDWLAPARAAFHRKLLDCLSSCFSGAADLKQDARRLAKLDACCPPG